MLPTMFLNNSKCGTRAQGQSFFSFFPVLLFLTKPDKSVYSQPRRQLHEAMRDTPSIHHSQMDSDLGFGEHTG